MSRPRLVTPGFTTCVRAFHDELAYLLRALRRRGVRAEDAEDLAQEVFVVMCRRWADYDHARPLRPWLSGIASRVAHDFRKRAGRELPIGLVNPVDEAPSAEERLSWQRSRVAAQRALASLPPKQRGIFELAELEGLPISAICVHQDISAFTAYARLRKARRAFMKAVRREHLVRAAAPARAQPSASA
jgi:RNA polymerase sigma-70 factor (ECF subfamily)